MKTGIELYVRQVKHLFPFLGKGERAFLEKLRWNLEDSFEGRIPNSPEEVAQEAGSPEEVVSLYFRDMSPEELDHSLRRSRLWRLLWIGCLLALFVVALLCFIWTWENYHTYVAFVQYITGLYVTTID